jgi:hypothetical protein
MHLVARASRRLARHVHCRPERTDRRALGRVAEARDAHDRRVLYAAPGLAGDMFVAGIKDKNMKSWWVWEPPAREEKKQKKE